MIENNKDITLDKWQKSLNYSQFQRFSFFEAKLLWEGNVNRQDVCDQFGVTANHFTREVREYKKHCNMNLEYDISKRTYKMRKSFQPVFTKSDPASYLELLKLYSTNSIPGLLSEMGSLVNCSITPEQNANIDKNILQLIIKAIHRLTGCKISYLSFRSNKITTRKIWPHALSWSGKRWHARAYDAERNDFIDIVLARIESVESITEPCAKSSVNDDMWHNLEVLEVIPNPELLPQIQKAIAREYGMKKKNKQFIWEIEIPQSLVGYFLDKYQLDEKNIDKRQKVIILKDQSILKKYSFKAYDSNSSRV